MMDKKLITKLEMSFEKSKSNISFDAHDGVGYIKLCADGQQLAQASKLLLLAGSGKTFEVVFYEIKKSNNSEKRKEIVLHEK